MASEIPVIHTISSHDLAREINSNQDSVLLLDCRPVFSFSSCHVSGAANINLASVMRKRFTSGKIGLADLISSTHCKELLQNGSKIIVYDESTTDHNTLPPNNTAFLVLKALNKMGKTPLLLKGGISEFGVLHPTLCEVSVTPAQRSISIGPTRATTPGQREQALDWKTAPPVFILSFLVLGSQKDAQCKEVLQEFGVKYILNVTTKCPNYYEQEEAEEGAEFVYKRIAVTDTGTQKLSQHFIEAFEFIELARKSKARVLIHCMAGISRSVTLTIAYLMHHFGLAMQTAYQYVKERRPAISPNLNFMGQLVEFENCATTSTTSGESDGGGGGGGGGECRCLRLEDYSPTVEQDEMSELMKVRATSSGSSSKESTPEASRNTPEAAKLMEGPRFSLKPLSSNRRKKKRISPRTSPRILTEDAVDLSPKKGGGGGGGGGGKEGGGGVVDQQPAVNVMRSLGGTATTVLSQLRRGSVEQTVRTFEKLTTD